MSRFERASMFAIIVFVFSPFSASAQGGAFAWVSADQPTAATEYVATPRTSRNELGGTNRIERLQEGVYVVRFGKLGSYYGGNAHAMAYGADNTICHVMYMDERGDDKRLFIGCTTPSGDFADTTFTASWAYHFPGPGGRAYTLVENPQSYVDANSEFRFQYAYESIDLLRLGPGRYAMTFNGHSNTTPNFRVTAYGLFNTARCKVMSTTTAGLFTIGCFDTAGALVDSAFFASYESNSANQLITDAHFRVNATASTVSDVFNKSGGAVVVSHSTPSFYIAHISNVYSGSSLGTVNISAMSSWSAADRSNYCKATGWVREFPNDVAIGVMCFNTAGSLTDSAFTLTYMR